MRIKLSCVFSVGINHLVRSCARGMIFSLITSSMLFAQAVNEDQPATDTVIVVIGAAGSPEFEHEFMAWAQAWEQLAERQKWQHVVIHDAIDSTEPKELLHQAIEAQAAAERLWIVLLGHGTFARNVAKFNVVGPDISAKELNAWLANLKSQVVLVNCSSSSAPFLTELAGQRRVLVTATRSGSELNYSRFGKFLASCINDPNVDIDHDREVSLLEVFLAASSMTEKFYLDDARLATEHALLNDNGDRAGTPADFYRGIRPVKEGKDGTAVDGSVASRVILFTSPDNASFSPELVRQRRDIEQQIEVLRERKSLLSEPDYFGQLESLLLQLASIYDEAEKQ